MQWFEEKARVTWWRSLVTRSIEMAAKQQAAQQQLLQQQQVAATVEATATVAAPPTQQSASERPQLNARCFDHVETFVDGEGNWQTWSRKIETALWGVHGVLADVMTASETGEDRTTATVLNDATIVDADQAQCAKASRELYSLVARCTGSEAAMVARSVMGLDGVDAWSKLHANCSRRTLAIMFRVQRECTYPVSHVTAAVTRWVKWKS